MRAALVLAVLVCPTVAVARPITAGVGLGVAHSEVDADAEANRTIAVFARVGLASRLSGQLELAKIQPGETYYGAPAENDGGGGTTMRTVTALFVVDLKDSGPWMPVVFVGYGRDRQVQSYAGVAGPIETTTSGSHIEGGFGLEYRAAAGLTLGIDLRMGGRSLDNNDVVAPVDTIARLPAPSSLSEGEYRSARITLGIGF